VISLEPNRDCFSQLTQNTRSLGNVTALNTTAESLDQHLPANYIADTLVCMNVLEHIQDDEAAVRNFARRLKAGGTMVLLVPGVPAVFGRIDQRLGHYRRYSKAGLRALLLHTGFGVQKLRYFNLVGLIGWAWNTRFANLEKQSDAQIRVFDGYVVPWLSRLEGVLPPPIGQSLLAVGTKLKPQ
jgi:SAM-dependent methyltransferase